MKLDFLLFLLDFGSFESTSLLQSFCHLDFTPLVYGMTCMGPSLFLLDHANSDLAFLPRSFLCLEPVLSVYGMSQPDLIPLVLDPVEIGGFMSLRSFMRFGLTIVCIWNELFGIYLVSLGLQLLRPNSLAPKLHAPGLDHFGLWNHRT